MGKYTCIACGKEFEASHRTVACPECKHGICVICGKEFERGHPYNQKTCCRKCSGIYRKQSGISKAVYEKAQKTVKERTGATQFGNIKPCKPRICKRCGKEFIPRSNRQIYCGDDYLPCPVCGKLVKVPYDGVYEPRTCSPECRAKAIDRTCEERYGNACVLNSEYGQNLRKQTCLDKYGVEHYSQTSEFHDRVEQTMIQRFGGDPWHSDAIRKKTEQTNIERRGYPYPTQSPDVKAKVRETVSKNGGFTFQRPELHTRICKLANSIEAEQKRRATYIARYGDNNPLGKKSILRHKIEEQNLEKYGSRSVFGSPMIREKIHKTLETKYNCPGATNPMDIPELRQKAIEHAADALEAKYGYRSLGANPEFRAKAAQTTLERHGAPLWVLGQQAQINSDNRLRISTMNRFVAECFDAAGIDTEFEFRVDRKFYDLRICDSNILIECNPTYTHNLVWNHWSKEGIPFNYHMEKSKLAEEHGYRCLHIWEWDDIHKIVNMFATTDKLYGRKLRIIEVDTAQCNEFLSNYHLQGTVSKQTIRLGLADDTGLHMVMTFGKPRYNHNYEWELLRLCTQTGYIVVGGASKLFTYFVEHYQPTSVISYCDLSKFTGAVYEELGFDLDHVNAPAIRWSKGDKYITDNLLRQRGYDQLFKTNYGKGTDNNQLMIEHGWYPVADCGQAAYVWKT